MYKVIFFQHNPEPDVYENVIIDEKLTKEVWVKDMTEAEMLIKREFGNGWEYAEIWKAVVKASKGTDNSISWNQIDVETNSDL